MDTNPYEPPQSNASTNEKLDVPTNLAKKIRNGWIAAIIYGVIIFGVTLPDIITVELNIASTIFSSVDIVLIFLLAFGIYKKNRFAATAMLLYFLASRIFVNLATGTFSHGWVMTLLFAYFYFQAMLGTYQYHKLAKNSRELLKTS